MYLTTHYSNIKYVFVEFLFIFSKDVVFLGKYNSFNFANIAIQWRLSKLTARTQTVNSYTLRDKLKQRSK